MSMRSKVEREKEREQAKERAAKEKAKENRREARKTQTAENGWPLKHVPEEQTVGSTTQLSMDGHTTRRLQQRQKQKLRPKQKPKLQQRTSLYANGLLLEIAEKVIAALNHTIYLLSTH
jgi:hypothetical protein